MSNNITESDSDMVHNTYPSDKLQTEHAESAKNEPAKNDLHSTGNALLYKHAGESRANNADLHTANATSTHGAAEEGSEDEQFLSSIYDHGNMHTRAHVHPSVNDHDDGGVYIHTGSGMYIDSELSGAVRDRNQRIGIGDTLLLEAYPSFVQSFSRYVSMNVCMHVCVYLCVCDSTSPSFVQSFGRYVLMNVCMYVCVYVCVCNSTSPSFVQSFGRYVLMHVCMYVCVYVCL